MKIIFSNKIALVFIFFVFMPGIASTAVSASTENISSLARDKLQKVKVQLKWRHQFQFAGYYAALEKGFYRDADMDVTLLEYSSGPAPIEQLLLGTVNFAVADSGAVIYRATGAPLVALAAVFQHSPSILLTRSDNGINELVDLRYRPLMLHGGHMNAELKAMLQNAGVRAHETNIIPTETSLNALLEKRIAAYNAYATNEPYFMQQADFEYKTFHPRDYGVDFYGDVLLTTEQQISSQPDLVKRFRQATLKGWEYAVQNHEEVVDIILAKFNTQNKARDHLLFEAEQSIELIEPNMVPIGYMNDKRWHSIKDVFQKQGYFSQHFVLEDFIYSPEINELELLVKVFKRHRLLIIMFAIVAIALLLLLHILSLRLKIRTKTYELERARLQAEEEARTDVLTNLPNRRSFSEVFTRDVALSLRSKIPVTLIAVDIDYFKMVNDEFGHAAGDEALRQTGKIFKEQARLGDIVARVGGEEFFFLCLGSTAEESRQFAERLRVLIEDNIIHIGDKTFNITCSFGVVEGKPGQSKDQILHSADLALYEAKQTGRNKVCVKT